MSQINPMIGSVLQTAGAQQVATAERTRSDRAAAKPLRDSFADRFEHVVESAEALTATDPQAGGRQQRQQHPRKKPPQQNTVTTLDHLDVRA